MHPVIAQAIAADRIEGIRADVAAAARARQPRRSRHARRTRLSKGAGHGLVALPARRPLRDPRAA